MKILPRTLVPPATEPVTLSQLRGQVRVDDNVDDAMLLGYLVAAREAAEASMGRPIVPRSVTATFESWPVTNAWDGFTAGAAIELLIPVTSVDTITYASSGVASQPWTGWVSRVSQGGITRVRPAKGSDWPQLGDDPLITLTATAGYANVPESIILAICQTAAHFTANRESVIVSDGRAIVAEVPRSAAALLAPHRWRWVG